MKEQIKTLRAKAQGVKILYQRELYAQLTLERNSMVQMQAYIYKKLLINYDVYTNSLNRYLVDDEDCKKQYEEAMSELRKDSKMKPKIEYKPRMGREDTTAILKAYEALETKKNDVILEALKEFKKTQ